MFKTLRLVTAAVTVVTGTFPVHHTATPVADSETVVPAIVMTGMSAGEETMTTRVASLFAEAGLELPPVEIRRHHDTAGCNGHEGLHRTSAERSVIDICTTESDDYEERTILHELGHAWSFHYLDPEHRRAFQELRGWEHWLGNDVEWEDNGAEQAAEVIVWALSDHSVPVLRIDHDTCADLHAGYVALTGLEPLHGYTDRCASHSAPSYS